MTQLQNIELDILKEFIRVCNELELSYFLVCGSALGAVKYGGFIPWDDDVDVGMFRDDYQRFLREAPRCLPKNLFLQTFESDAHYTQLFAKLRNSNTTYVEKSVAHLNINHGVYIDIFPLDGYPRIKKEQYKLEQKKKLYKRLISCNYNYDRKLKSRIAVKLMRLFGIHKRTSAILKKYDALISKYSIASSDLICNHGNWQGKLEYAPKWHYGNGTFGVFEGLNVRIPEDFNAYLTQKYGDWRADLPKEKQVGHHYYEICDLGMSYTEYFKKEKD